MSESIYKPDTWKLMQRDINEMKKRREVLRMKIGEILGDVTDEEAYGVLKGCLTYGWKKPNGKWRKSPNVRYEL